MANKKNKVDIVMTEITDPEKNRVKRYKFSDVNKDLTDEEYREIADGIEKMMEATIKNKYKITEEEI